MTEQTLIQGRLLGPPELTQVRQLLAAHPEWNRYRLSRELAALWDWRTSLGLLKDMAARTLLLKLAARGWIELPACRRASPNRMRHKPLPTLAAAQPQPPLRRSLAALGPLVLTECSEAGPTSGGLRALFESLSISGTGWGDDVSCHSRSRLS